MLRVHIENLSVDLLEPLNFVLANFLNWRGTPTWVQELKTAPPLHVIINTVAINSL